MKSKWKSAAKRTRQHAVKNKGGHTHSVTKCMDRQGGTHPQCNTTNGHTQWGGRTHSVTKRTDTQGGTHPQCNPTNGHTKLTVTDRHAEGQSHL